MDCFYWYRDANRTGKMGDYENTTQTTFMRNTMHKIKG